MFKGLPFREAFLLFLISFASADRLHSLESVFLCSSRWEPRIYAGEERFSAPLEAVP
jgi:hypothetical protein